MTEPPLGPPDPPTTGAGEQPLAGASNFRDVAAAGPHATAAVRGSRLYRSDSLHAVSVTDREVLATRFGVGAVLDLRTPEETVTEGRAMLGRDVAYANIPLEDVRTPDVESDDPLVAIYAGHLDHDRNLPLAVEMLALLLGRRPTVVSCAAGKDRTGMVTALTLALAGVPRRAIVEDFAASGPNMAAILAGFALRPRYRANVETLPAAIYQCRPSTITGFLKVLDERYGGPLGWAERAGVPTEAIHQLRTLRREEP